MEKWMKDTVMERETEEFYLSEDLGLDSYTGSCRKFKVMVGTVERLGSRGWI